MSNDFKGTDVERAMNVLVETTVVHAIDVDKGYQFTADYQHFGVPIGEFEITVRRTKKP